MGGWANSTRSRRLPPDWRSIRRRILTRDQHLCRIRLPGCTHQATDVDHVVPGDDHSDTNLQAACLPCHLKKTVAERPKPPTTQRPAEKHPGLTG
jgi:5-methylcytosine-specific restriction endonuclease McrA